MDVDGTCRIKYFPPLHPTVVDEFLISRDFFLEV